jgi:hypothetical protein
LQEATQKIHESYIAHQAKLEYRRYR